MKQNAYFIVILVFLLAACNSRINCDKRLVQADSLMMLYPDSALTILEAYPIENLRTQADNAYYALNNLIDRMYLYNLKLHESLIQEFRCYLQYKLEILSCSKNENTPLLSNSDCRLISNFNNLEIRLSSIL